jgi:hypothetical protein
MGLLPKTLCVIAIAVGAAWQGPPLLGAGGEHAPMLAAAQCSPQYQRLLQLQIQMLKRIQKLARSEGERLCVAVEAADQPDRLIDPKALSKLLTQDERELLDALGIDVSRVNIGKLMRLLGIDLDLRELKHQCRQAQGGLERFASDELGRLASEVLRCEERV